MRISADGVPEGCRRTFRRNPNDCENCRIISVLHKKDSPYRLSFAFCLRKMQLCAFFIPFRIYRFSHVPNCWYG